MKNGLKVVRDGGSFRTPAPAVSLKAIAEMTKELIESGVSKLTISEPRVGSSSLKVCKLIESIFSSYFSRKVNIRKRERFPIYFFFFSLSLRRVMECVDAPFNDYFSAKLTYNGLSMSTSNHKNVS